MIVKINLFLVVFTMLISCNYIGKERDRWDKDCNDTAYNTFKNDTIQQYELLNCINQFEKGMFRGKGVIRNDTLHYGWHQGVISNEDLILETLQKFKIYAFDYDGIAYFAKGSGFKFRSCGLMYVPNGLKFPHGIEEKRFLASDNNGKWYYVKGKL